jgi:hypothetical protein
MKEEKQRLSESLLESLSLTWHMYDDAIKEIPDEHWRTGEIDYLTPARLIYHVLEAADFYTRPNSKGYPWGHRFGANWESASPDQLPDKGDARDYLEDVKAQVESWVLGMGDEGLLAPEPDYTWTGSTLLGRSLYMLAHCRQHLGEINAELRRRGLPRIKWRTL